MCSLIVFSCICVSYVNVLYRECWYHLVFFFKQKTAYEMRISDWSSDVCSSDLRAKIAVEIEQFKKNAAVATAAASHITDRARPKSQRAVHPEIGRASCRERVCQYV